MSVQLVKVNESYGTWGGSVTHTPCAPPKQLGPVSISDEMFTEAATFDCALCGSRVRIGMLKPDLIRKERRKHLPLGVSSVAASVMLVMFALGVVTSSAGGAGGKIFFAVILGGVAAACGAFAYSELSLKAYHYHMEMVIAAEQPCRHGFRTAGPKNA